MVVEDAGYAMICLELSNVIEPTQGQIWVNVSSLDGDATTGMTIYNFVCALPCDQIHNHSIVLPWDSFVGDLRPTYMYMSHDNS